MRNLLTKAPASFNTEEFTQEQGGLMSAGNVRNPSEKDSDLLYIGEFTLEKNLMNAVECGKSFSQNYNLIQYHKLHTR